MVVYEKKNILKHTQMTNTFDTKIVLQNFFYIRDIMALIFTDFSTGSES